jgi:zinc transporter ZupT
MTDSTRASVVGNGLAVGGVLATYITEINTYLQFIALVIAIISGIMTIVYHYNKNKKL